mmetsp:Transcript_6094/g.9346  ORF Transcript_6094/g.9346 Transcript_6094/m.9346 type:complete len:359 (+) Transcript_6094:127-1203(+)
MLKRSAACCTSIPLRSFFSVLFVSYSLPRGISFISKRNRLSSLAMSKHSQSWSDAREEAIEKCFLPLSSDSHKGSSGRVGVLGGSQQYTGAPFYAGMSALQCGADLCYIFCADEAALAIKSYSPELMVTPVYKANRFDRAMELKDQEEQNLLIERMVEKIRNMMDRLHVLVLGPGLGRCPLVLGATAKIIEEAISRKLPLVLDADALFLLTLDGHKELIVNYDKAILTPNVVEYKRLLQVHHGDIAKVTKNGIIVKKGKEDVIFQGGEPVFSCCERGGLKRSGGLGDVLAGSIGTLVAWNVIMEKQLEQTSSVLPLSCWAACCITRKSTARAFAVKRRAMTAPDVLNEIGPVMIAMEE